MSLENKCPEFEELSSWYDKQSSQDYTSHVTSCAECQSVIEDLKKIDAGLSHVLTSAEPNEGLKDRILTSVAEGPKKEPIRFMSHILKLVAILASAFVLNYLATEKDNVKNSDNLAEQNITPDAKKVPVMVAGDSNIKGPEAAPISESLKSDMTNKGFQLVGIDSQTKTITAEIKQNIKHVWVALDVNKAIEELNANLQTFTFSNRNFDEAGSFHIKLQISQKELIEKVNFLSSKGLSLVSPDLPQPNSNHVSTSPDEIVTYEVSIIKKQ